jgi:chromosome segregation ATPase
MSKRAVERRLRDVGGQLRTLRDDLRITEEQLAQMTDEADDARIRALVSETPVAEREHRRAGRHAEVLRNHRDEVVARIATLESDQDALLDRLGGS